MKRILTLFGILTLATACSKTDAPSLHLVAEASEIGNPSISRSDSTSDWPMFHGPNGDNKSPETGLLESWPEGGPELLWQISDIGEGVSGYSSIAIQAGRLFTSGNRNRRSMVFCYDSTGRKLWEYDNGPAWTGSYPGTRSTPTVDGGRVYDLSPHGELVCLNVETGKPIWSRNILNDYEGKIIMWALAESVRIDGQKLICSPGGRKASVVALDKMTGKPIWEAVPTEFNAGYSTSTVFTQDGLRILAQMNSGGLMGIDIETGKMLFTFPYPQDDGMHANSPIYHDGHLAVIATNSARNRRGVIQLRVSVNGNNASVSEVWRNNDMDNLFNSVVLLDGYLYGSAYENKRGVFLCIDWKTGKSLYERRDAGRGCLTYADGLIYYLGETGEFRLIRPNPEKYDVASQWTLPENGEGNSWAHPVIHDKKLYIRHGVYMYCYDIAKK